MNLLQGGLRARRVIGALRRTHERDGVEHAILLERQVLRDDEVSSAVGVAGEHAVLLRKDVVEAAIPSVLRLHEQLIEPEIVNDAGQIRQREDLQQILADRVEAVAGYLIPGEGLAGVGVCVVGGGIVDGGHTVEIAGAHCCGGFTDDRGGGGGV